MTSSNFSSEVISSLSWDLLSSNSSTKLSTTSQKLLTGRMEFMLVLLYSATCLGGLLANTALIIAILGRDRGGDGLGGGCGDRLWRRGVI